MADSRMSKGANNFKERYFNEEALRKDRAEVKERRELLMSNSFIKQRSSVEIQEIVDDGVKYQSSI